MCCTYRGILVTVLRASFLPSFITKESKMRNYYMCFDLYCFGKHLCIFHHKVLCAAASYSVVFLQSNWIFWGKHSCFSRLDRKLCFNGNSAQRVAWCLETFNILCMRQVSRVFQPLYLFILLSFKKCIRIFLTCQIAFKFWGQRLITYHWFSEIEKQA